MAGRRSGVLPKVTLFSARGFDLIEFTVDSALDFHLIVELVDVELPAAANLKLAVGESSSKDLSSLGETSSRMLTGNIELIRLL